MNNWLAFFFSQRFYLFIHERHRERERQKEGERERQRHRKREKQAPCREPDVGLDPPAPGSHPESKEVAQLLSHTGIPFLGSWELK